MSTIQLDTTAIDELLSDLFKDNPKRLAHINGVRDRAIEFSRRANFSEVMSFRLQVIALLHDVGYASNLNFSNFHPVDGAKYVEQLGYPSEIVRAVLFHSGALVDARIKNLGCFSFLQRVDATLSTYEKELIDIISFLDFHTLPTGKLCSYQERRDEILSRHGATERFLNFFKEMSPYLEQLSEKYFEMYGIDWEN